MIWLLTLSLTILLVIGCYNRYACWAMHKEVLRYPRDPETSILCGAESLTLTGDSDTAVLLVHGFLSCRTDFHDLPERLNALGLTVRALRLPGHGTYPVAHAVTTAEELREAVRRETLALKKRYRRVYLIGFSMGGALAALTAASETVDGLVLLAPYFRVTHRWRYLLSTELWIRLVGPFVPYVVQPSAFHCVARPGVDRRLIYYHIISTRAAGELAQIGREARHAEFVQRIQCPVLLLHSKCDRAASPQQSERFFRLLPSNHKRIVWYHQTNHFLCWDNDEEAVKAEIIRFLDPQTAQTDHQQDHEQAGLAG